MRLVQAVHLKQHNVKNVERSPVQTYQCERCNKTYKYSTSLYNHQKFECGKTKSFVCIFCQKRFWHKQALKNHVNFKRCKIQSVPNIFGLLERDNVTTVMNVPSNIPETMNFKNDYYTTTEIKVEFHLENDMMIENRILGNRLVVNCGSGDRFANLGLPCIAVLESFVCQTGFSTFSFTNVLPNDESKDHCIKKFVDWPIYNEVGPMISFKMEYIVLTQFFQLNFLMLKLIVSVFLEGYSFLVFKQQTCQGPTEYRCDFCNKSYQHKASLVRHFNLECGVERKFECRNVEDFHLFSNFAFKLDKMSSCYIFEHGFSTYRCQKCPKVYKYRSNLLRHLRFECGVLPQFVCKLCGRYFTQKSSLKSHVAYIHGLSHPKLGAPLKSTAANKRKQEAQIAIRLMREKLKAEYEEKRRKKERERCYSTKENGLSYFDEEGYFCCATCHKRYKRKHGLNQHQRLECNKPPQFCCKLCPKAFKQKNNLKVHVYSVHKVPFEC
nr:unnamed protein product [Callosobruchus chinensis]